MYNMLISLLWRIKIYRLAWKRKVEIIVNSNDKYLIIRYFLKVVLIYIILLILLIIWM